MNALEIAKGLQLKAKAPTKPTKKRVAVYARYSSVKQSDLSIEGQLREATDYCLKHDYAIVAQYVDQAKSGRSRGARSEFNRMMEDSSRDIFDIVLVYKFNRFFRNLNQQSICLEELKKNGVDLLSIRDPIPDGRGGIYMRAIYGADAEAYSVGLSEDTKRGMLDAHREGKNIGMVPFGYTVNDRRQVIDPGPAGAVRMAFEMYAEGYNMSEICVAINAQGWRTRYGNPISGSMLSHMLRDVKYMGLLIYKGEIEEAPHLRIIEPELFQHVQEILATRVRAPQRGKSKASFELTGKLFCGHCGQPMFGDSGTSRNGETKYYYTCKGRKKTHTCKKSSVPKEVLEQAVFRAALQSLTDENIAQLSVEAEELSAKLISNSDLIRSLHDQIRTVDSEIKNIGRAIAQGIITSTTKQFLMDAEQRREELERELSYQESIARRGVNAEEVAAWLMLFRSQATTDSELKSMIFRKLVQEVYVFDSPTGNKDDSYIIVWLSLKPGLQINENLFGHSQTWGAKYNGSEVYSVSSSKESFLNRKDSFLIFSLNK